MKREFYVDTPLGKMRVWAKHESDCAADFPGVNIDLVDEKDGDIILAVVEYDSVKKGLQACVYGDVDKEEPTHVVELQNLPKLEKKLRPYLVTLIETSSKNVIIYAADEDEAREEAQTLWDLQEIVLDSTDFDDMVIGATWQSVDPSDLEVYPVYGAPECDEELPRDNLQVLKGLIDYTTDMEREWDTHNDHEPNVWSDDVRALRWAVEKLEGIDI